MAEEKPPETQSIQDLPNSPVIRTGPGFWTSLGRAQVASLAATGVDFGATFFLVEVLGLWYVAATASGAFLGAITNFLMGRHWSFEAAGGGVGGQAWRYALVSAGSLLLNSGGVYLVTEYGGLKYGFSKAIMALLIGFLFNFPLHRHYVFGSPKT